MADPQRSRPGDQGGIEDTPAEPQTEQQVREPGPSRVQQPRRPQQIVARPEAQTDRPGPEQGQGRRQYRLLHQPKSRERKPPWGRGSS